MTMWVRDSLKGLELEGNLMEWSEIKQKNIKLYYIKNIKWNEMNVKK